MRVLDNSTQELLAVDPLTAEVREITNREDNVQHIPAGWLSDGRVLEITDQGSDHLWLAALDPANGRRDAIDHPTWDVELAASSIDGRVQIWSVNEDGYSRLRWRQAGGPTRERELRGVCEDLVLSTDGTRAAFSRISATEPWQVWTLDIATGEARVALTTTFGVPAGELVEPEVDRIPAGDGDIPCLVYRAPDAPRPVAVGLHPHRGPSGPARPEASAQSAPHATPPPNGMRPRAPR